MTALTFALAAVGFLTAGLSGVAGIGGGTILIAVFYAMGPAPGVAVPLHGAVQFVSNLSRTVAYRRHVEWRAAGWFLLPALPLPFLVAPFIAYANVHAIELVLALLILGSLRPEKKERSGLAPVPAFLLAGFLNGTIGMFVSATGLFIGRLFLRPEWNKETVIATLAMTQTLGHLIRVLAWASAGFAVTQRPDLLVPLVLAVIAGTWAGQRLNRNLDEARFRTLFKTILAVLSLKLLWDGVRGLVG